MASVLKELISFCESKQLTEVAQGLKEQLQSKSIMQVDTLQIIKDALAKEDRRSAQNQAKVD